MREALFKDFMYEEGEERISRAASFSLVSCSLHSIGLWIRCCGSVRCVDAGVCSGYVGGCVESLLRIYF